ncbi:MAG: DUF4143 domain-containing protein [Bacilli bacterium]|nr:DUF4143 domain-containing protein [Bacilli bacterium]
MNYYVRYIDQIIERYRKSTGAIVIVGPKFCGKTTSCNNIAKSIYRINTKAIVERTTINPKIALEGEEPHLIDEWQKVPDIWNYIKEDLDIDYKFGKYLLTGSSTPADKTDIQHSGAGRLKMVKMRTMSLFESKESLGIVSLRSLFENKEFFPHPNQEQTLEKTAFQICRGGWPLSVLSQEESTALDVTNSYYDGLFQFADSKNEKFRNKKTDYFKTILKSYARNVSTSASMNSMINDVRQNNERILDDSTFRDYLEALKDLYIIEDLEAWCPNIRSKTAISSSPTRHFVDPSIACSALGIGPKNLMNDFNTFGFMFEDLAVRDLRIYSELLNGTIKHYKDNAGLECDSVIHLQDGKWAAVEIKLGGEELVNYGAKKLNLLKNKLITKSDTNPPTFMAIITAFGPCYKREDGIYVIPLNCLKD